MSGSNGLPSALSPDLVQAVLDHSNDIIARFDRNLRHTYVSPAIEKVTQRPQGDFVGKTNRDLDMPEDLVARWDAALREVMETGSAKSIGFTYPSARGPLHFEGWLYPEPSKNGPTASVLCVTRDVTERKRIEDLLAAQNDLHRHLSSTSHVEAAMAYCVQVAMNLSGMDSGGVYFLDPDSQKLNLIYLEGISAAIPDEIRSIVPGTPRWNLVMAGKPVFRNISDLDPNQEAARKEKLTAIAILPIVANGEVLGCINLASHTMEIIPDDIRRALQVIVEGISTAIVRIFMANRLAEREAHYRKLFEQMHEGFALHQILFDDAVRPADFRYLDANPAFEALTGLSLTRLKGASASEIIPDLEPEWLERYGQTALTEQPASFEQYARAFDKHFDVTAYSLGKGVVASLFRDISERKRSERAVKDAMARSQVLANDIIHVLVTTIEARDPFTAGHQRRVSHLASAIAAEMGYGQDRVEGLSVAGMLHDIGKIAIPAEILSTPRRLTTTEYQLIQTHAQAGYEILRDVHFPWPVAQMAREHHERLNGSGYPLGLAGSAILPEARILAVADVVEAMASHRPYRPANDIGRALDEITAKAGILYDLEAVSACLRLFRDKGYRLIE